MVVNTVSCSLCLTSSHATGSPALPAPCHVFLRHVHEPAAFTQRGCSCNTKWWFSPILHLQVHPSDPAPVCATQHLEVWNSPSPHGHQPCPTGSVLHHPLGSGLCSVPLLFCWQWSRRRAVWRARVCLAWPGPLSCPWDSTSGLTCCTCLGASHELN